MHRHGRSRRATTTPTSLLLFAPRLAFGPSARVFFARGDKRRRAIREDGVGDKVGTECSIRRHKWAAYCTPTPDVRAASPRNCIRNSTSDSVHCCHGALPSANTVVVHVRRRNEGNKYWRALLRPCGRVRGPRMLLCDGGITLITRNSSACRESSFGLRRES